MPFATTAQEPASRLLARAVIPTLLAVSAMALVAVALRGGPAQGAGMPSSAAPPAARSIGP
jgi:hypothetical protein